MKCRDIQPERPTAAKGASCRFRGRHKGYGLSLADRDPGSPDKDVCSPVLVVEAQIIRAPCSCEQLAQGARCERQALEVLV